MRNTRGQEAKIILDHPLVSAPGSGLRCREIASTELEQVIDLLTIGFQKERDRTYWINAIQRLIDHPTPRGFPKYGYVLENNDILVGVLLLIFSARTTNNTTTIRCNGSSLYVMPAFRGYAAVLIKRALRFKNVTYLNLTPTQHTLPMLAVQGYKRFANGTFICLPILCAGLQSARIETATPTTCTNAQLQAFEPDLLLSHVKFGCLSLIATYANNSYPFVFGVRTKHGVRLAHLVYCRDQQDFVRFVRPLGRFLRYHQLWLVVLDANGPIAGLRGIYLDNRPKFAMGPEPMRLGDVPFTERVMFGY